MPPTISLPIPSSGPRDDENVMPPVDGSAGDDTVAALGTDDCLDQLTDLWVFGYGSLLWNTGFVYSTMEVGYIERYSRKFWQGNITHRGTPDLPGRVATLVEDPEGRAWGAAFHVVGATMVKNCLDYLGVRECHLGGYTCQMLPFITRSTDDGLTDNGTGDNPSSTSVGKHCKSALTCLATPSSPYYLGPVALDEMANQVVLSHGPSGSNVEYVVRLAEFVRAVIPEDKDEHLFDLERKVRERLEAIHVDNLIATGLIGGSETDLGLLPQSVY